MGATLRETLRESGAAMPSQLARATKAAGLEHTHTYKHTHI